MNQYLVQNFIQVIDLYENLSTQSNLGIKLSADKSFQYTFVSAEQLQSQNMENASFSTTSELARVINSNARYLLLKAASPTIVNLERVETSDQVELFGTGSFKAGSTTHVVFLLIIAALVIFCVLAGGLYFLKEKRGLSFERQSFAPVKSNWRNLASELRKIYSDSQNRGGMM